MSVEWHEVAAWVGAAGAFATAVIAVVLACQLRNRERRQALVELHASLTSHETASARNTIGTLLYSKKHRKRVDQLEAIEAYFQLIWALQRARNVFRVHGFHWQSLTMAAVSRRSKRRRAQEIELALTWNLTEIADNVVTFHREYCEQWEVEDADAWEEMRSYLSVGD